MIDLPEELIIDANILFSFFKEDSVRKLIIKELTKRDCKLVTPDFVLDELLSRKEKIMKYSSIDLPKFLYLFKLLNEIIKVIPKSEYETFLSEAHSLSPHPDSSKDDPYFALSLSLNNCPIWSDESAFKKQSKIKIFSTKDLLELVKE